MAIYSCSASTISRGAGRSAVAAAAYRAGEELKDARTGLTHDYTRKGGVLHSELMTPAGSPAWAQDREALWNAAEAAEDKSTRRATATTAREFRIALPHELTHEERVACVREFGAYLVGEYGVAVDFAIHAPDREGDERNFHAHILTSDRVLTDAGFKGKVRGLNVANGGREALDGIRAKWAEIANRHLEAAGHDARIDHRSNANRGLDQAPTIHLGPEASGMERRGEESDRGDVNRAVAAENAERVRLKAEAEAVDGKISDLEAARQRRAEERAERAAVLTHSPERILEAITARRSTFTESELAWMLQKTIADPHQRKELVDSILARPEVVGLAEREGGKATRYTTAAVLDQERRGMDAASAMAADRSHAVSRATLLRVMEKAEFGTMNEEQRAAFLRATGPEGFTVISGEAGTGKSYTASAIRQAEEAEGHRVIGLSFTNKVIQDMKRDGFAEVRTITGALQDLAKGRTRWDADTRLVVDEFNMLATKDVVALLEAAEAAGAKVTGIGDRKQAGSAYNAGGMFGALEDHHGSAVLQEVIRVKNADEAAAWNAMHRGNFREAVRTLDQLGRIQWGETREDARTLLVSQWAKDSAEQPDAVRFVFCHTNAEAKEINAALRTVRKERGEIGDDHILPTKDGPVAFAKGDRVQFTGSAYWQNARDAGLANGMVGTVQEIDSRTMTVALDGKKGAERRVVSFTVGENGRAGEFNAIQHGHAGTVYRGEGSTVDEGYYPHSPTARASTNYVAMTRHREHGHIFAARDVTPTLDHLARQMGRQEENRAASQFERAAPDPARSFGSAAREAARRTKAAEAPTAPATEHAPTARQTAEAQTIAARLGKIMDPAKTGLALFRQHRKDATGRTEPERRPLGPQQPPPTTTQDAGQSAMERLRARMDKAREVVERDETRARELGLDRTRPRGRTR